MLHVACRNDAVGHLYVACIHLQLAVETFDQAAPQSNPWGLLRHRVSAGDAAVHCLQVKSHWLVHYHPFHLLRKTL